jgi:MscS family membrane protein
MFRFPFPTSRVSLKPRLLLPLLAVLLLLAPPATLAAQEAAGEAAAAEAPPPVPAELASPRAALETFITAVNAGEQEPAISVLDLSGLPVPPGVDAAWELAVQLKDVIDRTRYVVYDKIPADAQGPPYVFLRRAEGEVTLAPGADGAWRFTPATVDSIQELWKATLGEEVAAGVKQVHLTPGLWLRSKMPPALTEVGFLLEAWQWLGLLLLIFVGIVVDRLLSFVLQGFVARRLKRRLLALEAPLVGKSLRPWGLLVEALIWRFGLLWLNLPPRVLTVLRLAVEFFAIFAVVWGLYRLVDILSAVLEQRAARTASRYDDLLVPLVRKSLKLFVAAFGLVFLADNLDIQISSLLAGLGLGGLAFALAAQDLLKNLFGSTMVLLDRPFQVGDWVVIGGDVEGTVEEVGFRSTRIRTFYNSLITLPNSNLISSKVDNLGARRYRRWSTQLSIAYSTPPETIEAFTEGVRELIRRHPFTRKDYFEVYLNSFAAASLDVLLYVFWETPDWDTELRERHRLMLDVLRLASRLGVEFAFPTQTLYLRQEEWQPPESPGPEGYGERVAAALVRGRREARELVETGPADPAAPPAAEAPEPG